MLERVHILESTPPTYLRCCTPGTGWKSHRMLPAQPQCELAYRHMYVLVEPRPYYLRYNLLLQCWELKPANRPHFNNLVSTIGRVLEISADYLVFTDTSTNVEPASHSFKAVEEHMPSQL